MPDTPQHFLPTRTPEGFISVLPTPRPTHAISAMPCDVGIVHEQPRGVLGVWLWLLVALAVLMMLLFDKQRKIE